MATATATSVNESPSILTKIFGQESGDNFTVFCGDACDVIRGIPDCSIGFGIHSPPFSNIYCYSDSMADMGNATDDDEFFAHYDFLIPELYRVTIPGRLCAVHCKDLPLYFGRDGEAGLKDFPGEIIRHFIAAGWTYHSRVTIWKDPVIEMQRTKNNGLLHKTLCRDSSQVRQGMADYLLVFRRMPKGSLMSDKPVTKPHSRSDCFDKYVGSQGPVVMSAWCKGGAPQGGKHGRVESVSNDGFGLEVWQRYASPVWFDIDQTRVLNYRMAKTAEQSKHIAPLQLDVIDRSIELWTSPGDVVLSPFAGIGSEGYCSILAGRKFIGIELSENYFKFMVKHLRIAEEEYRQKNRTLLDGLAE